MGFTVISKMSQVNVNCYLAIWFAVFEPDREGQKEDEKSAQHTINPPLFMRTKVSHRFNDDADQPNTITAVFSPQNDSGCVAFLIILADDQSVPRPGG